MAIQNSQLSKADQAPAKKALRQAIDGLNIALERMREARSPLDRYEEIRAQAVDRCAGEADGEVARLREVHHEELLRWIEAGAVGTPPVENKKLVSAERRVTQLVSAASEAEKRIQSLYDGYVDAVELVRSAQMERDSCLWLAAFEACTPALTELESSVVAARRVEGKLRSLILALREAGYQATPHSSGAFAAAEKIEIAVGSALRVVLPAHDASLGRNFLDRLKSDPTASM